MAVLKEPIQNQNPFAEVIGDELPPIGTYVATVLDVIDEFGVTRTRYQSSETEKVDLACFLFGLRDPAGNPHRIASKRMRISGNEKSALFGFLKSLLGRAPEYGWDYCKLKGTQCLLTVEHIQRRDGTGVFAGIATLSPVPPGFGQPIPPPSPAPAPVPAPAPQPAAAPQPQKPYVAPQQDEEVPF
ncbi:MAG: hypothetical protein H7A46_19430 [Verrucomicrobiales bacterium]|nr:hypothetical protein [Verrucomicrobiales bacterium]